MHLEAYLADLSYRILMVALSKSRRGQFSDTLAGTSEDDATHDVAHDQQHSELIHGSKLLYPLMEVLWVQAVVS